LILLFQWIPTGQSSNIGISTKNISSLAGFGRKDAVDDGMTQAGRVRIDN